MKTTLAILAIAGSFAMPSLAGNSAKAPAPIAPPKEEVRRALSYDYVEIGYASILSHDAGDFYGGYANVSWSPTNNLYVFGRLYGFGGSDSALDASIGAGVYVPLFRDFDFILEAGYNFFDIGDGNQNGLFVSPGFRTMVTSKLELNANATVTFPEDGDTSVAVGGGFVYYLRPNLGLTGGYYYDLEDQSHFLQAGVRYIWR